MKYCGQCNTKVSDKVTKCIVCNNTEFVTSEEYAEIESYKEKFHELSRAYAKGQRIIKASWFFIGFFSGIAATLLFFFLWFVFGGGF